MSKDVLLASIYLRDAAEHATVAYWMRSRSTVDHDFHVDHVLDKLNAAVKALGYTLTPIAGNLSATDAMEAHHEVTPIQPDKPETTGCPPSVDAGAPGLAELLHESRR